MKKENYESNYLRRIKIIGVMGGSPDYPDLTEPLGKLIARMGYHLLTGAGGGIMEGVSESFFNYQERRGLVLGIVRAAPSWDINRLADYAPNKVNQWVEVPIYTHLRFSSARFDSRNHINALTSDIVIALPGEKGTESEVELALQYGTPVIFFLGRGAVNNNAPIIYTGRFPQARATIAGDLAEVEAGIKTYIPT